MSITAYKTVWSYGLKGAALVVALALAEHHNGKTGQCNPGYDTIAELTGLSRRHVIRVISKLGADGHITIDKSGGYHSNQYGFNDPQTVTFETPNSDIAVSPSEPQNSDTAMSPSDPAQTVTFDAQTVTFDAQTVTFDALNSDTAMSPEPVEPESEPDRTGRAERPTPPKPHKPLAVLAYANVMGYWPPRPTYRQLAKIPEDDIPLFEQIATAWAGQGWNPKNINGMMDFYKRREIPGAKNDNRNSKRNGTYQPPGQSDVEQRRAEIQRRIAAIEAGSGV